MRYSRRSTAFRLTKLRPGGPASPTRSPPKLRKVVPSTEPGIRAAGAEYEHNWVLEEGYQRDAAQYTVQIERGLSAYLPT